MTDNLTFTNLNSIRSIILHKKQKVTNNFTEKRDWSQWLLNIFRKKKIKEKCIIYHYNGLDYLYKEDELNQLIMNMDNKYIYHEATKSFYIKPYVEFYYGPTEGSKKLYFDTEKEASNLFNKIIRYAKENNIPLVNLEAENNF